MGKSAEAAYNPNFSGAFDSFYSICTMDLPYTCLRCRQRALRPLIRNGAIKRRFVRPSFAPKPVLDLKHIRQNPGLYEQNCNDRNYAAFAQNGWKILEIHNKLVDSQRQALDLRQRSNAIGKEVGRQAGAGADAQDVGANGKAALLEEAKVLKSQLAGFEAQEKEAHAEMERLALELPNLSSLHTPVGDRPDVLGRINEKVPQAAGRSHVEIGKALDILDFEASATTSGWGWYFLKNEGAMLEQALIQYALSVAMKRGWMVMTPPSLVYSHIAHACGFMPRDHNGETQIYGIAHNDSESGADKPSLVLAGTAEIPFAGSQANQTLNASDLPLKVIGPSRSYRAEAGARGVDTKGLYRVHEFTKVEMFAWTVPPHENSDDRFGRGGDEDDETNTSQGQAVFDEMLEIQTEILTNLGLHARILEMPSTDLGASATRKIDMEAFFPSRTSAVASGFGEVTSASMCTDYQARRLGTRLRLLPGGGKLTWPHTLNGTALAVPRILACLLENHWDERTSSVRLPVVLQPYMPGNTGIISRP